MFTTELTVMMPLILLILLMFMFMCYFIAVLNQVELEFSSLFASHVLNIEIQSNVFEATKKIPSIYDDGFRLNYLMMLEKHFTNPFSTLNSKEMLRFELKQMFSMVKRDWILLASIVYEGGVGYFDAER